ncbi:MerC domain-containing protein [uncultured Sphingomonas sp.]|uniref:MerC domain-containing protein n=1 Tax=uncultured Sphingomonas sp. TaxID=158754 RepID=UPI0025F3F96E|nr:MerC domain-containing protein [uncultured Sphingomonas sp.]
MMEALAIGAAAACLIHCLALPLIVLALPVVTTVLPIPTNFHLFALVLAVPTTAGVLFAGYRRHHLASPLVSGVFGLTLLTLAVVIWDGTVRETLATVVGSLFIAAAHLANWHHRKLQHAPVA